MTDPAATDDVWTVQRILQWTTGYLTEKGVESARLEAELLLKGRRPVGAPQRLAGRQEGAGREGGPGRGAALGQGPAADVDGANRWQKFRYITLPLLRPALFPAIILGSIWTFNMFNIIYLVSGGQPVGATDILITEAFRWAFERGQGGAFGYAASYSTLIFLMLLAYTTAANRVARAVSEENPS